MTDIDLYAPEQHMAWPGLTFVSTVDVQTGDNSSALFGPAFPCLDHADPHSPCAGCHPYRYALTRRWARGSLMTFIMLNPSTADAWVLDPTVRRCRSRAAQLGYGGLLVLNAFALRSVSPKELRNHPDPVGPQNDEVMRTYLLHHCVGSALVVVGWGADATINKTHRDDRVLDMLHEVGRKAHRIGPPTKDGHPRHPLYLRNDAGIQIHGC